MALESVKAVAGFLPDGTDDQFRWLDPLSEQLQGALTTTIQRGGDQARKIKDILNGTWLGHSLHPALTDVPVGAWTTAAVLDAAGAHQGADIAIGLGVVGSLPTAAAGLADWHDTSGKVRRVGMMHAVLNTAALGCYVTSLAARRAGGRGLGIGLSTIGLGLVLWSSYLGGEMSFGLGQAVNRNAWSPEVGDPEPDAGRFRVAARSDSLVDGQPGRGEITLGGTTVPLVLLKRGSQVFALNATCAHMGGPLDQGKLVDGDCVECPWHGSRFSLHDGSVVQGPSAYPQPRFEARLRAGNVEVRPLR